MEKTFQVMYKNKKVEDCTKDELVKFVYWLEERRADEKRWHREDIEMEQLFKDTETKIRGRNV